MVAGALLTAGSLLLGQAYSQRTNVVTVTTVIALIPVFAAVINWVTGGQLPSVREGAAALLAMASVVLLAVK